MDQKIPNTELSEFIWPTDIHQRRGPVLCLWVAVQWFFLVVGTVGVFGALSARSPVETLPFDGFVGLGFSSLLIVFSVVWAIVTYFAFCEQLWAMRAGICISLLLLAVVLSAFAMSLYQAAMQGYVLLVLVLFMSLIAQSIAAGNRAKQWSSAGHRIYDATAAISILVFVWWFISSDPSQERSVALARCFLLSLFPQFLAPYIQTCRVLFDDAKKSIDLTP